MSGHEADEDGGSVTIPQARLLRVTEAIALASAEAFDEAITHLGEEETDDIGLLEEALRMFLGELRDAKRASQSATSELVGANRELTHMVETVRRQEAAIRELSAPILEIWEGIVSIPVIGALDTARAIDITERLLRRVVTARARWVIVDLTGLADVDAASADHLLRLARAVRLVGGRCVVTGIRPSVANTLMEIGADLGELRPMRSLREGLQYCIEER